MSKQKNRRNFIKESSLAAAGFFIVPRHVIGKGYTAPSDKLTLLPLELAVKASLISLMLTTMVHVMLLR